MTEKVSDRRQTLQTTGQKVLCPFVQKWITNFFFRLSLIESGPRVDWIPRKAPHQNSHVIFLLNNIQSLFYIIYNKREQVGTVLNKYAFYITNRKITA